MQQGVKSGPGRQEAPGKAAKRPNCSSAPGGKRSASEEPSTSSPSCPLDSDGPILFQVGRSSRACLHALIASLCAYQLRVMQVGHLGAAYMDWVHHPVAGQPLFFASPPVEALTKTPW